jgi:predicted NBD/HSP70 family sugar kinase
VLYSLNELNRPGPGLHLGEVTGRLSWQALLVAAVHATPGIARASAARQLGMSSGLATETTARLVASGLLAERPAPPAGRRGRPTTSLHPHPHGPLVAAAAITHETWRVAAVQLGGTALASTVRPHGRDQHEVLAAVADDLGRLYRRFGPRIQAVAVAVPGTVIGSTLMHAPNLGWHDVDLSVLWPCYEAGQGERWFAAGNDATLAAIAEARRGAAAGAGAALHLYMDAGVGGAMLNAGQAVLGAHGMAGEFGHMPFGDPGQRCACGAIGCWNTSLNGHAVARALGDPPPRDEVGYLRGVLAAGRAGQPGALGVLAELASWLGRGTAGLVNALDPHVVTVGGLGRELLEIAGEAAGQAYLGGLMAFRAPAPPLIPARLGDEAPLVGAAEEAFSRALSDEGLGHWTASRVQAVRPYAMSRDSGEGRWT